MDFEETVNFLSELEREVSMLRVRIFRLIDIVADMRWEQESRSKERGPQSASTP